MTNPVQYPLGSQVRITGTFTNLLTNQPEDPTDPTLFIAAPGQEGATPYTVASGVVKDSTGVYHYDLVLDQSGTWWRAWRGTEVVVAAEEDTQMLVSNSRLH